MRPTPSSVSDFLNQKHIAVFGVSRESRQPANAIYRTLRDDGYEVVAINPQADTVEGNPCYHKLSQVPGPVDAAVVVTPLNTMADVVRECAAAGVNRVWLHSSFGLGKVPEAALQAGEEERVTVISHGCPLMYRDHTDPGHRCMRWAWEKIGKLPA